MKKEYPLPSSSESKAVYILIAKENFSIKAEIFLFILFNKLCKLVWELDLLMFE